MKYLTLTILTVIIMQFSALAVGENVASVIAIRGHINCTLNDKTRELKIKDKLFLNEVVETGKRGRIQIMFTDGSIVSLGRNTTMLIESYEFNKEAKKGKLITNVKEGIFRVMGGAISKIRPEEFKTKTPTATIGIRGSMYAGNVAGGKLTVVFMGGRGIYVYNQKGQTDMNRPGRSVNLETPDSNPADAKQLDAEETKQLLKEFAGLASGDDDDDDQGADAGQGGQQGDDDDDDDDDGGILAQLDEMLGDDDDDDDDLGSFDVTPEIVKKEQEKIEQAVEDNSTPPSAPDLPAITTDEIKVYEAGTAGLDSYTANKEEFLADNTVQESVGSYAGWGYWAESETEEHGVWVAGQVTAESTIADYVDVSNFEGTYRGGSQCFVTTEGGTTTLTGTSSINVDFSSKQATSVFSFDGLVIEGAGTVSGSGFTGNLTTINSETPTSSSLNGTFFGPAAESVGGNYDGSTSTMSVNGAFNGVKK